MSIVKIKVLLDSGIEDWVDPSEIASIPSLQAVIDAGNQTTSTVQVKNADIQMWSSDLKLFQNDDGTGFFQRLQATGDTLPSDLNFSFPFDKQGVLALQDVYQSASDPTTDDVTNGRWKIWYNTTTGVMGLWGNIANVLACLTFNFPADTDTAPSITEVVGGRPRHLS